jgi:V/A-type H+-transporting ATPase subunit F
MRIFLISDNTDTRTGMRLVGVDGVIAHTRAELSEALDKAVNDRNIGIIAVSEKLAAQNRDLLDDIRNTRRRPLLVDIPDRHGTDKQDDFLSRYVREAIGVKL